MFDITAFGELLIDYTPAGKSPAGMDLFEQNPGGAPANVLACASSLGSRTAFLGKIGADMQGQFLRNTLNAAGVNTDGLISDENWFTTLAFVSLSEGGERSFSFARKPGADTMIRREELDLSIIRNSRIFHFGSLSLTDNPSRDTTNFALGEAKKAGCLISYDPNFRPLLWKSRDLAIEQMRSVLPFVDIIKLSDEESELLTGHSGPRKAAEHLIGAGIQIVAVTLGKAGALVAGRSGCCRVTGFRVDAVDTTGAGDAFWGAFLYSIDRLGSAEGCGDIPKRKTLPGEIGISQLAEITRFANAAAAHCVAKRGAIPSMPRLNDIEKILRSSEEQGSSLPV